MLQEVWCSQKLTYSGVAKELEVPRTTLRGWIAGAMVPPPDRLRHFLAVVARAQGGHSGTPTYSEADWEAAIKAAQKEAKSARHEPRPVDRRHVAPGTRFIGLHDPASEVSVAEVRLRANERAEMKAFVQDSRPEAPSYLCWHADGPVGKTTLLAGYVRHKPPVDCDILTFFVSETHGTDTRGAFEREIADQIALFLGRTERPVPKGTRAWNALFAKAAAKSAKHERRLLLIVDGLDDDVAWSDDLVGPEPANRCGTLRPRDHFGGEFDNPDRAVRRSASKSMAALLPSRPPPNMRVIVSLRRCAPLPRDVPEKRHPLRQSRHMRTLLPLTGVPKLRQPPPDITALGEPVVALLAVADGGLRTTDLAELTGLCAARLDRLAQGPAGRALVTEDPLLGTYALADSRLVRTVCEDLGEAMVLRCTEKLLLWSRRWHAAGWPDDTPPYPLRHQLRLLSGTSQRASYVLDPLRLRQLARTTGPDIPLAQLDSFETEISAATDITSDADRLATLISLYGARSLLRRAHDTPVPDGAPALYVRLGDAERARGLARSAPTAVDRAVHLADMAVELAYAGQPSVGQANPHTDVLVREAAEWLARDRAHQGFPGALREPEPYARLLCAAGTLTRLNGPGAARPILRAVLQDPAAGTAAITEAAGELDAVMTLYSRAEMLSAGDLRARTAAVELYGALAQVAPYLSQYAGNRIEAVCEELDDTDGLGSVDVLATAASALVGLPAKRHRRAAEQLRKARARLHQAIEALRDPDSPSDALSEADRAHLRRELAGTLERLAKATVAMEALGDLDDIRHELEAVPVDHRVGMLGDPLLERAQLTLEAAEKERNRRACEAAQRAAEKSEAERKAKRREAEREAKRRKADAERAARNEACASYTTRATRAPQPARTQPEDTRLPFPARRPTPPPRPAPTRRPAPPRRSTGLLRPGDGPYPDRPGQPLLPLLLEADDQASAGRLLRAGELLEEALRSRPAAQLTSSSHLPDDWTAELCQAMGAAGASDEAEALVRHLPDTPARARHLAALSLGCSLAGHDDPGAYYARTAARSVPAEATPGLAHAVAQALAHAGDEAAATAMARGNTAQRFQALTAIAAGLVRHDPEAAARVAEPLVEVLTRRMGAGGPHVPLPELAALLLAFPDVRTPAPRLSDVLGRAALRVAAPATVSPARSMSVLALLERLGCLPDEAVNAVESAVGRWRYARQSGPHPLAELALLAALNGDTPAVWRYADAARTPDDRAVAFGTAAAHLAGAQVAPAPDSDARDRVIRTCLALARVAAHDSPPAEGAARDIVLELLRSDAWSRTIPLLPSLAPGALKHLGAMAREMRPLHGFTGEGPSA